MLDKNEFEKVPSAWQYGKDNSVYHYDTTIRDMRWDTVVGLGKFGGDWTDELNEAISAAKPVNITNRREDWAYRGDRNPYSGQVKFNNAERNDFAAVGADPEMTIFRVNANLSPTFAKMVDMIGLGDSESRLHIQFTGEAFIGHVDRFEHNWPDHDLDDLIRIGVMLKDYEQGQFFQFGNHCYQFWRAGDIHTFSNKHVPHYTANSGLSPRVTLFTTGVITDKTRAFLKKAKHTAEILI